MLIFDLVDLDAARERVAEMGVRVVWQIDLPDISGTHLHPGDMAGAIVSIDGSRPYGSWRWGGPEWTAKTSTGARARLQGVTVAVSAPDAVAQRWAQVLGAEVDASGDGLRIPLDGGEVRFREAEGGGEGLCEIALALPEDVRDGRSELELGGVRVALADADG
jgi:hypothetical protein